VGVHVLPYAGRSLSLARESTSPTHDCIIFIYRLHCFTTRREPQREPREAFRKPEFSFLKSNLLVRVISSLTLSGECI
jgi:hypothetical protein